VRQPTIDGGFDESRRQECQGDSHVDMPLTAGLPRGNVVGSYVRSMESAGTGLGVEVVTMSVQSDADIETGIVAFARQPGGGLIQIPDSFTGGQHSALISAVVARNRLPALYASVVERPFDGLMAYFVDTHDLMHRAADYVDRILKGANPAELPVQRPTRFNLVINRKVADALGLTISPQLSAFADEVIE
jgi:putative ABC transport system substrate-binding protein